MCVGAEVERLKVDDAHAGASPKFTRDIVKPRQQRPMEDWPLRRLLVVEGGIRWRCQRRARGAAAGRRRELPQQPDRVAEPRSRRVDSFEQQRVVCHRLHVRPCGENHPQSARGVALEAAPAPGERGRHGAVPTRPSIEVAQVQADKRVGLGEANAFDAGSRSLGSASEPVVELDAPLHRALELMRGRVADDKHAVGIHGERLAEASRVPLRQAAPARLPLEEVGETQPVGAGA